MSTKGKEGKTYGFFHPYCNAGGGGEKVLWGAVQSTLDSNPNNKVVIYTGDIDATSGEILQNVIKTFDIKLDGTRVDFKFLKKRYLVDHKTWPFLTLLGQAFGSIILAYEAASLYKPDIWVESMGYPFTYPLIHYVLGVPIVAYTHYPVISKDMLGKLDTSFTSLSGLKQLLKYFYWSIFMLIYTFVGSYVSIGLTNSTWTYNHIKSIWFLNDDISILYPPCSTENYIDDQPATQWDRKSIIVSLAQFRPEKRHGLIIEEYKKFLDNAPTSNIPKLVLIGSTRGQADLDYVDELKQKVKELKITPGKIEFILNAKYEVIQEYLKTSSFGLNAMWNEHFGIAVVEYVASGLIPIVHASAGPLLDIVVPWDSKLKKQAKEKTIKNRTGFFFKSITDPDYANFKTDTLYPSLSEAFLEATNLTDDEKFEITSRGKECVLNKFSNSTFDKEWIHKVIEKVETSQEKQKQSSHLVRNALIFAFVVGFLKSVVFNKKSKDLH